jgi:arylsulfatase A-like enzyme
VKLRSIRVLSLLIAFGTTAACSQRIGAERANVLVIVVDTLRADHLGCYGYERPTSLRLDELASSGVRFDQARAASSWTLPSVASMLSGVYPAVHGAEHSESVLSDALDTVAEDFLDAGYETVAFSANPAFVTPRQGLARGFERFDVLHGEETDKKPPGPCLPTHHSPDGSSKRRRTR